MIENATDDDFKRFNKLHYENKILITNQNNQNWNNIYVHKVFKKKGYYKGKILKTKNKLTYKTFLDDFDYVSFLNKN